MTVKFGQRSGNFGNFGDFFLYFSKLGVSFGQIESIETSLTPPRQPRSMRQLKNMIHTGTTLLPMEIENYGCWCGSNRVFTGFPVDEIDMACHNHFR